MFPGHQIVQSGQRDPGDGNVRFAAIIAFHAPFAAAMDLNIVERGGGGKRQQGQLRCGGDAEITVRSSIERGVAHRKIAIERG